MDAKFDNFDIDYDEQGNVVRMRIKSAEAYGVTVHELIESLEQHDKKNNPTNEDE